MGEQKMKITVVAAVGIAAVAILAVLLIQYLVSQTNPEPQPGQSQEPNGQQ